MNFYTPEEQRLLDQMHVAAQHPFETAIQPHWQWLLWGGVGALIGGPKGAVLGVGLQVGLSYAILKSVQSVDTRL